jgi:hypothetical protein
LSFVRKASRAVGWGTAVAVAATVLGFAAQAGAAPAGATWGKAQQVSTPATRAKSEGGITSVSCAPGGYCAAVGFYQTPAEKWAAYVTTGTNGDFGRIQPFNLSGIKQFIPPSPVSGLVSCPSAGNCVAVGTYTDTNNAEQPFAVSEKDGTWGKAQSIPDLKAVSGDLDAEAFSLACASASNCVVGGQYQTCLKTGASAWCPARQTAVARSPAGSAPGRTASSCSRSCARTASGAR